jgi:hypothetical protein
MILLLAMGAMMATPAPVEIGPREKVIAVAESLVGVTELTGKNDGPLVEAILASTGNKKGDPYCAAFNYYCYREAGLAELVPKTAWSPSWVAQPTWTRAEGGGDLPWSEPRSHFFSPFTNEISLTPFGGQRPADRPRTPVFSTSRDDRKSRVGSPPGGRGKRQSRVL